MNLQQQASKNLEALRQRLAVVGLSNVVTGTDEDGVTTCTYDFQPVLRADDDGDGEWVTINGVHVFIGKGGTIEKGPAGFIGKKPSEISKSISKELGKISKEPTKEELEKIQNIAEKAREDVKGTGIPGLFNKDGSCKFGSCGNISASVKNKLHKEGYKDAEMVNGAYKGVDHIWVEIPSFGVYIDASHDQFKGNGPRIKIGKITDNDFKSSYSYVEEHE